MAYTAWSVVFGEQPTAAKWNQLGTNDAGFKDGTNFDNDIIKSKHLDWAATGGGDSGGIWWEELGRTTLGSASDTITLSGFAARKHLLILADMIATGGTVISFLRFNNDSGNNYTNRFSDEGGADSTNTSTDQILFRTGTLVSGGTQLGVANVLNPSGRHKYVRQELVSDEAGTGAGAAPSRLEGSAKWASTTQVTRVDLINGTGTGDLAAGSSLIVLGHD